MKAPFHAFILCILLLPLWNYSFGVEEMRMSFYQISILAKIGRVILTQRSFHNQEDTAEQVYKTTSSTSPCLKYSLSQSFYFFFILEYILLYPYPFTSFWLPYFPVFKKWLLSFQLQLQGHLKMLFSKHFDQRTVLQSRWLCTRWSVLKQYGALSLNPHRWTIFRFHGMQVVPYLSDLLSLGHLKERSHLFPFVSCYLFACIGINLWETWRLDFGGRCMQIFFWLFTHASCWSFLLCMIHHHLLEHISKVLEWCVHFLSF